MAEEINQAPPVLIEHVSVKAPEFMETAVTAWFSIIEAQFAMKNIVSSATKFYNVLSQLPSSVVAKLPKAAITGGNYDTLKSAVIYSYEKSKPEILEKLMQKTNILGKPSLYLQEMVNLAERIELGEDIIKHKFIKALPSHISPVLAASSDLDLNGLGKLADTLMMYIPNDKSIMNVDKSTSSTFNNTTKQPTGANFNANDRKSDIPYGLRPFSNNQRPKVCRAHLYYGGKAKYCKPWCCWPNKNNVKIEPSSRPSSPSPSSQHFH